MSFGSIATHSGANLGSISRSETVIACGDPNNECQFVDVSRQILCLSPILKGYIEQPDTRPPGVDRYKDGSIALNNEGEIVKAMLKYLERTHNDQTFTLQSHNLSVVLLVRLYKLALSLGYDPL